MKATIEDISLYKKLVNALAVASNKKVLEAGEQCINIQALKTHKLILRGRNSRNIFLEFSIDCNVDEEGSVNILSSKLLAMTKKLNSTSFNLSLHNKKLRYAVPVLGSISEPIFHDQEELISFSSKDVPQVIVESNLLLHLILKSVSSYSMKNRFITFVSNGDGVLYIYCQFDETGYIRYSLLIEKNIVIKKFITPDYLKLISTLGDDLTISHYVEGFTEFSSALGTIYISDEKQISNQNIVVDKLIDSDSTTGYIVCSTNNIQLSLDWQSYNKSISTKVNLRIEKGKLVIDCSNNGHEPSLIACEDFNPSFGNISININSLSQAIATLSKNSSIPINSLLLESKVKKVGDEQIKYLCISPYNDTNIEAFCILYENY